MDQYWKKTFQYISNKPTSSKILQGTFVKLPTRKRPFKKVWFFVLVWDLREEERCFLCSIYQGIIVQSAAYESGVNNYKCDHSSVCDTVWFSSRETISTAQPISTPQQKLTCKYEWVCNFCFFSQIHWEHGSVPGCYVWNPTTWRSGRTDVRLPHSQTVQETQIRWQILARVGPNRTNTAHSLHTWSVI